MKTKSDVVDEFIDNALGRSNSLSHAYASKYYDPVKAHEYYMRTRKLKGRRPAKELRSKAKKETWAVAKDSITKARQAETKSAGEHRKKVVENIRSQAKVKRTNISEKLKARIKVISQRNKAERAKVSANRKKEMARIASETKRKVEAVPAVPKGLSKSARAAASEKRAKRIAAIRGESYKEREKVSNAAKFYGAVSSANSKKESDAARAEVRKEREKLSNFTKALVSQARNDWQAKKEQIKAKYEAEYDREYEAIKRS